MISDTARSLGFGTFFCLAYARSFSATIHLLHVIASPDESGVTQRLAHLVERFRPVSTVVRSTLSGSPAREIVDSARRHAIDLIVIGTHGRSEVTSALLGSVVERVLRTAPCPVLVVPPGTPRHASGAVAAPDDLGRCVVCGSPSFDALICTPCRSRIRPSAR